MRSPWQTENVKLEAEQEEEHKEKCGSRRTRQERSFRLLSDSLPNLVQTIHVFDERGRNERVCGVQVFCQNINTYTRTRHGKQ
jgi:hypothetical protein